MNTWVELLGYLGSALVVCSVLMTSVVRLRLVNMAGSILSGVYGLIIGAYPLVLMNACLLTINGWQLWKLKKASPRQNG